MQRNVWCLDKKQECGWIGFRY